MTRRRPGGPRDKTDHVSWTASKQTAHAAVLITVKGQKEILRVRKNSWKEKCNKNKQTVPGENRRLKDENEVAFYLK